MTTFLMDETDIAAQLSFLIDLHFKLYECANPSYKSYINERSNTNTMTMVDSLYAGLPYLIDNFKNKYVQTYKILSLLRKKQQQQ